MRRPGAAHLFSIAAKPPQNGTGDFQIEMVGLSAIA